MRSLVTIRPLTEPTPAPRSSTAGAAIQPGTPFRDLPADWKCPVCDGPREQFMVLRDPGRGEPVIPVVSPRDPAALLEAEFREIYTAKMRDVPFCNHALHVEAVGFQPWQGHVLGVLVTPWFMNLTLLPGPDEDWSALVRGEKELVEFPSGTYEFLHANRERIGGFKGCSLFSPMGEFASQLAAVDVARAVMIALFDDPDRPAEPKAPTRRALLTGGSDRAAA